MLRLHRTQIWQRLDQPGSEYFELWEIDEGWQLKGSVILDEADTPLFVQYAVTCGTAWNTTAVRIALTTGTVERQLNLRTDGEGRWWRDGEELSSIRGCMDIDLAFTPATNTLPIRRLGLSVGEHRDVTAAWFGLPNLDAEPLPQRYTRLSEQRYRYESHDGGFVRELDVDDLGLVITYPALWTRVVRTG
jgi:hypothetical protein